MKESDVKSECKMQCTVNTRFMENYGLTSSLQLGVKTFAVYNTDKSEDLFTLRGDNFIERIYMDEKSGTGFKTQKTDLHGSIFSVCQDKDGQTILFASQAEQLFCMKGKEVGSKVFDKPFQIRTSMPYAPRKISQISTRLINDELWIGLLVEAGPSAADSRTYAVFGKWNGNNTILTNSGYSIEGTLCIWSSNEANEPVFVAGNTNLIGINAINNKIIRYPKFPDNNQKLEDLVVARNNASMKDVLFAAFGTEKIYALNTLSDKEWSETTVKEKVFKLGTYITLANNIGIFALSDSGMMYHGYFIANDNNNFTLMVPIKSGIRDIAVVNDSIPKTPSIFASLKQGNAVSYLLYEDLSSNWNEQIITLSGENDVRSYTSYTSEITIMDELGIPIPNIPIWVWSNEATRIEVNGLVGFLDGINKKIRLTTSTQGKIYIAQETFLLAVPDLFISFSNNDNEDDVLSLSQYASVEKKLTGITSKELMEAKKDNGSFLLNNEFRTKESTESLAQALNQCMSFIPKTNNSNSTHFKWISPQAAFGINSIVTTANFEAWSLKKEDNKIVYANFTPADIDERLNSLRNESVGWNFFRWMGDLLKAAAEKVIEIVEVIIYKVGNVIKTAITYIADKVQQLFEGVIRTVQEIFNVVENIFDEVVVFFKDLFEWLGFLFNWKDILRTKEASRYLLEQQFLLIEGLIDLAAEKVDSVIDSALNEVRNAFKSLIDKIDPNTDIGSCINASAYGGRLSENQSEAFSNNFVLSQYLEHDLPQVSLMENMAINISNEDKKVFDDFIRILQEFVDSIQDCNEFKEAITYFSKMFTDSTNLFRYALSGLLKVVEGLAIVALNGVRAVVKLMLTVVKTAISTVYKMINTEVHLPFVSTLYKKVTGSNLSLLELPCLLLSIPVTVLYKLANKTAPFKDENALERFKKECSAQRLLDIFYDKKNITLSEISALSDEWVQVLTVIGAASAFFYYLGSAVLDVESLGEASQYSVVIMAMVSETVWDASSAIIVFWTETNWWEKGNFIAVAFGLVLDLVFIGLEKKFPKNATAEWPKILTLIYGGIALTGGILSIVKGKSKVTVAGGIATICSPVIIMSKIGLSKKLISCTQGISAMVTVAIDNVALIGMPIAVYNS